MSDIDERIKEWQRASEAIVGRVVMWLGKEAARGVIYAVVGSFVQNKLPFLVRSGKSDQEIMQELMRELSQSTGAQLPSAQEDTIRRIIQEELYKARIPQTAQPPAPTPYPQPVAPPTPYPTPTPAVQTYDEQLRSINEEITHYERLRRILEERWAKGEIQEEEFRKKLAEINSKLDELRLRRERLLYAYTPR
jgi:hypothetical protein